MTNTERENGKPKKIYKYVSYEVAKIILSKYKLKFSPPSSFNDPYDCDVELLDFKFDGIINGIVRQEIEILKSIFKKQANLDNKPIEFWEKVYKGSQLQKIKCTKISCFSLINDNQLMWSHYADKHKGICFEFDNLLEKRFVDLVDSLHITEGVVGYDSKERINYIAEERGFAIYKLFFTKGEEWNYEKEYRLILLNQEKEFHTFSPYFIRSVYFGVNVVPSQKEEIINLCKENAFTHISFFEGKKDTRTLSFNPFSLTIRS